MKLVDDLFPLNTRKLITHKSQWINIYYLFSLHYCLYSEKHEGLIIEIYHKHNKNLTLEFLLYFLNIDICMCISLAQEQNNVMESKQTLLYM